MKLRKDQRYTMYCILLEEAENPSIFEHPEYRNEQRYSNEWGLCWMWYMIIGNYFLYRYSKQMLPELYNKKNSNRTYWFNNWEERIEALEQCIAETENF